MTIETQEEQERIIAEHIKAIIAQLNVINLNEKEVAKVISETIEGEHRTLQQTYFRVIQNTAVYYGRYASADGRNEASRDWCNQVADIQQTLPFV